MTKGEGGLYEEVIDGDTYAFEKWGAEGATDTLLDITSLIGKPLGVGISSVFSQEGEGLDKKVDPNMIGLIMEALTERVSANKQVIKALIKKLSSENVLCNGQKVVFNTHYQDKLQLMFKVIKAALEVQYGNFFAALIGPVGIQSTIKGIMNRASPTSSGPSGGQSAQA